MQKRASRRLLSVALLILIAGASAFGGNTKPLHEQVLAYLRTESGVVPQPLPDVHPVRTTYNHEAVIPPQCYTRTEGRFNPCYVCHQMAVPERENRMNDGALQLAYSFSDVGLTNHWSNLFEDRRTAISKISDEEILDWIDDDNYSALPDRLRVAEFGGWIPDLADLQLGASAFDEQGFALDGSQWVAFNYKPLPSTFWPTNGATDDVMIRLPPAFREDFKGRYSRDVYMANLSILEATVKGLPEVTSPPIDESTVGIDLDADGTLGRATRVRAVNAWVGAAAQEFHDTYLYPEGTEFLHTVRYLGFDEDGRIAPSTRIKEVRYMKKSVAYRKSIYARNYQLEGYAKEIGQLPQYRYLGEHGLDNGYGWYLSGFIEDREGELRAATYEETLFCMGCHTSAGSTIDKTFSLPRKVDGAAGWGYINLVGMPDAPTMGETLGEYATYLSRVGGGGEFRSNTEMQERWLDADLSVDPEKLAAARDVHDLITPSRERALALNKAYRLIVAEQDYIYGRDPTIEPPANVYEQVDNDTAPTLPASSFHEWDIRLAWPDTYNGDAVADDLVSDNPR